MSALDVLRSFAESRASDHVLIRDGLTYGQARELVQEIAASQAREARLREALEPFGGGQCPAEGRCAEQLDSGRCAWCEADAALAAGGEDDGDGLLHDKCHIDSDRHRAARSVKHRTGGEGGTDE